MAQYLITGVAGFIGSTLARTLLEEGHSVRGVDNLSTGSVENIAGLAELDFVEGDICDASTIGQACRGVEFVLHQAALASVPRSVADPLTSHNSNINGTLNVLLAAREAGVKRIVYAASSSAYGDQPTQPKYEEMPPQPMSPYAVQKLTCEYYLQSFCKVYGMQAVCLRYFNIFGPRQAADSPYSGVIAKFVHSMMNGQIPMINGDGSTSRDFTFVGNAVQANLLACVAPDRVATGRVFNVGTGHAHTLNDLYSALAQILKFPHPATYGPARVGDVAHSLASITRSQAELGYQPNEDFYGCLQTTVEWYQSSASSAADSQEMVGAR